LKNGLGTGVSPEYFTNITHGFWVFIGDENALSRSRPHCNGRERSSAMTRRRRFKQIDPLDKRLSDEAIRLRQEADDTPPGVESDQLVRRARQAETAAHMSEWLNSPGLKPPI
jgi:hypothetical protein